MASKNNHSVSVSFLTSLFMILLALPASAQKDSLSNEAFQTTGFFSATGTITIWVPSPEKLQLDSITWKTQPILLQRYGNRRVKKVLYQQKTNRVVVFVSGGKVAMMSRGTALKMGLIADKPLNATPVSLPVFLNMYIDSPVFVGINNIITLGNRENLFLPVPSADVLPTGNLNEYSIKADQPGPVVVLLKDSITGSEYSYNLVAKRLPDDTLNIEPVVQLGTISTQTTTPEILKTQQEIIVSDGFSLAGANAYFSGTGFVNVSTISIHDRLGDAKNLMDICLPGSSIIFDEIRVKDRNGKIYDVPDVVINVVDTSYTDDPTVNYYESFTNAEFRNGDVAAYVKKKIRMSASDGLPAGNQQAGVLLKIGTDGSVSSATKGQQLAMSKLARKCFDIIVQGPKWKPATYKGVAVETIVGFSSIFEIPEGNKK